MEPLGDGSPAVNQPSLNGLLRTVFDMSDSELDLCLCVMENGEQTVTDLAEKTAYDRSMVSRHLNHLVELGVLDKQRRLLEKGGHVYVYSPKESATIRDNFRSGFLNWVQEATACIETVSREKVESIVDTDSEEPQWRIYQE
jgi:predicted transcriptional regulator